MPQQQPGGYRAGSGSVAVTAACISEGVVEQYMLGRWWHKVPNRRRTRVGGGGGGTVGGGVGGMVNVQDKATPRILKNHLPE